MLIIYGVDVTNPVHKPVVLIPSEGQLKDNKPEKLGEVKMKKPVNLIDCGVLHFPTPE
jgi:hypothetical protein